MSTLPPGVVEIREGDPCPPATLCLWRDINYQGPVYGIGAGYNVDLRDLPIKGGVGGNDSMFRNVSSWLNSTASTALLIGRDRRELQPGAEIKAEDAQHNDTVERVEWKL